MTLADLIAAVYTETNRPDYVAETLQAIQSSTLKMHGLEYFFRDIAPNRLIFDSEQYIQVLDTAAIPRYRSPAYMRKWAADAEPNFVATANNNLPPLYSNGVLIDRNAATKLFKIIDPEAIFDEFGTERVDVCYQVGDSLMFRSSTAFKQLLGGWYQWPDVRVATYSSWIARDFPYAIVFDAASNIFQKAGQQDTARKYDAPPDPRSSFTGGLVWSHIHNLKLSNITAQAR